MNFTDYMKGLFEPDAPELAFYLKFSKNGHFRYYAARKKNKELADTIFILYMLMFEYVIARG
jgi:hypothetical protein